ncbi:YggT family protein [Pseudoalteromonas luteoviolacea]|uniref:Membrane protein n=1 Tax=Pseudoalteromonas luteoviolacea DSM 6061 TaxID=1365250 RepID=A0A167BNX8_9GAMM|nr:YggT family protein [Pseudoalteromonas luteoviolacea]KZN46745.1 membrane protein [Pseudoalteromonas luteoviolacea DSM 6061]MBE0384950.1 YggT family protein [Pseudoalteromonas luteoviolacea DSM 6061]
MSAMHFLIETLFNLFLMVVLLRFWMQWARVDFYNPLSQAIVKATSFAINPLRKIVPGFGGFDMASLVLAYIVACAKVSVLMMAFGGYWDAAGVALGGLLTALKEAFSLVFWILVIRALLSWVVQGYNPVAAVFEQLTEPLLRPIRKVIPPLGGLDLSIMVVLIGMMFLQRLVMDFLH